MSMSEVNYDENKRVYGDEIEGDGQDYPIIKTITSNLMYSHIGLEIFYIAFGIIPMAIINIVSILTYVFGKSLLKRGHIRIAAWIILWEVLLHVLCVSFFIGGTCGCQQWLFGTFCTMCVPAFLPILQKKKNYRVMLFAFLLIGVYLYITVFLWWNGYKAPYDLPQTVQMILFCSNTVVGFYSIRFFTKLFTFRMGKKNTELKHIADYDALTGLYNRQRMQRLLDSEIEKQQERVNPLCIAIMDVDFFKNVNDTFAQKWKLITLFFQVRLFL